MLVEGVCGVAQILRLLRRRSQPSAAATGEGDGPDDGVDVAAAAGCDRSKGPLAVSRPAHGDAAAVAQNFWVSCGRCVTDRRLRQRLQEGERRSEEV
ncbi:hypothetical protein EMIT0373P_10248 [Pseudomonas chlororaphis]